MSNDRTDHTSQSFPSSQTKNAAADYKDTLNLADTSFAMRADLAKREPLWLERWQQDDVYGQIRAARQGAKKYILHDGPPYANGQIHLGHVVNKVLKDIVVKYKTLDGYDAPFVPGWDCHGLPIEQKVESLIGKVGHVHKTKKGETVSASEFRAACRAYAKSQVQLQMADFQRLGVLADWQRPYLTMDFQTEADTVRALGRIYANGHIARGLKPVNWCLDCGSALAEAEVEYEDKRSDAIYVGFDIVNRDALPALAPIQGKLQAVIWTTTPWTLPANQAIAAHADLPYSLICAKKTPPLLPIETLGEGFNLRPLRPDDKATKDVVRAAFSAQHDDADHKAFEAFFARATKNQSAVVVDKAGKAIALLRLDDDAPADRLQATLLWAFLPCDFAFAPALANEALKRRSRFAFCLKDAPADQKAAWTAAQAFGDAQDDNGAVLAKDTPFDRTAHFLVASDLVEDFAKAVELSQTQTLATLSGAELTALKARHPLISDRVVPIITGEHVTADSGTGLVHTAPAHGVDDYNVGLTHRLPTENPVAGNGVYLPEAKVFVGEHIYKAQPKIIAALKQSGHLLCHNVITHSYPHCWRHKTPIIFRATAQWFIGMDKQKLKDQALADIPKVVWTPAWGQNRIEAMVQQRPDWCISRQRTWGVPIAFFIHKDTQKLHPNTAEIIEKVAQAIEKGGVEAWFEADARDFIGEDADDYVKCADTLDVWFDSGSTNFTVLENRPDLGSPADLYLEGSDQHRGWFQSSLLVSESVFGRPPYKQALTHGFTVDAKGYKLSKSKGNTKGFEPAELAQKYGIDIVRLWVGLSDYRYEMAVSKEGFDRVSDVYRRVRNTVRFLLANTDDFDPTRDAVDADALVGLDKYILRKTRLVQESVLQSYANMDFHQVCQTAMAFCAQDLGGVYLDIIKDRQYTTKKDGHPRRSAQTAIYHIAHALLRWIAPILSFTAQEAWETLKGAQGYIFTQRWYDLPNPDLGDLDMDDWACVLQVKDAANKAMDTARSDKVISSGLSAKLTVQASGQTLAALQKLGDEAKFVFIVSQVRLTEGDFAIEVLPADGQKCARCWHVRDDVGQNATHPSLCPRCIDNAFGNGESRRHA